MKRMSRREMVLATIVGAAVVLLINFAVINFFLKKQRELRKDLADRAAELETKQLLLAEKDAWASVDVWLESKLPKLTNETRAGSDLLKHIETLAKKHAILPENATIGTPSRLNTKGDSPVRVPANVSFGTKSSWPALVAFLRDMQGPEQFIVFENATIEVDKTDNTQIHGQFRVARWFAVR